MSLFGALFSGVSGLQSQGSAMGAIADNVTNINTVGYKGTSVNFRTLVTSQASTTQYSPGGVQSSPRQGIDIQTGPPACPNQAISLFLAHYGLICHPHG